MKTKVRRETLNKTILGTGFQTQAGRGAVTQQGGGRGQEPGPGLGGWRGPLEPWAVDKQPRCRWLGPAVQRLWAMWRCLILSLCTQTRHSY